MAYSGSYPWNNNYYSHGQSSGNDSWAPSAQSQEVLINLPKNNFYYLNFQQYNPVYPSLSGTPNFFSSSAQVNILIFYQYFERKRRKSTQHFSTFSSSPTHIIGLLIVIFFRRTKRHRTIQQKAQEQKLRQNQCKNHIGDIIRGLIKLGRQDHSSSIWSQSIRANHTRNLVCRKSRRQLQNQYSKWLVER